MSILISKQSQIEGYTLLWDIDKCRYMIGEEKFLHVIEDYHALKSAKECKLGLIKNKDIKMVKLRDKLFQEDEEQVMAVIEAFSEPTLSLDEYITLYSKDIGSVKEEVLEEIPPRPPYPTNTIKEEPVQEEKTDGDSIWNSDIFGSGNIVADVEGDNVLDVIDEELTSVQSETATTLTPERKEVDYLGDIDMADIPDVEIVEPEDIPEVEIIDDTYLIRGGEQQDFNKIVEILNPLHYKLDFLDRKMEGITTILGDFTEPILSLNNANENYLKIIESLKEVDEAVYESLGHLRSNEVEPDLKIPKQISPEERKLINSYKPNPAMINYLKVGFEGTKQETVEIFEGIELMEGFSEVVKNSSDGLIEFISKYFPFVLIEYNDQVLEKMKGDDTDV